MPWRETKSWSLSIKRSIKKNWKRTTFTFRRASLHSLAPPKVVRVQGNENSNCLKEIRKKNKYLILLNSFQSEPSTPGRCAKWSLNVRLVENPAGSAKTDWVPSYLYCYYHTLHCFYLQHHIKIIVIIINNLNCRHNKESNSHSMLYPSNSRLCFSLTKSHAWMNESFNNTLISCWWISNLGLCVSFFSGKRPSQTTKIRKYPLLTSFSLIGFQGRKGRKMKWIVLQETLLLEFTFL